MGIYKVFDGTNWVNPCDCDIRVRTSDDEWKLLDPKNCPTKYWDGESWCLIECPGDPVIDDKTEINIWFDSSGSMGQSERPLEIARDQLIQDCFLPFYNNDLNLYNTRVKFIRESNERTILQLGTERNFNYPNLPLFNTAQPEPWVNRPVDLSVTRVINLVFSDENDPRYYSPAAGPFDPNVQLPDYIDDVTATRNLVNSVPYTILGTLFRIKNSNLANRLPMRQFVEALFFDNGLYTPPLNLSDLPFNYNANLDTELGFKLSATFNNLVASNGVDWVPGIYVAPIISNSGAGVGMTVNIEAEAITDGLGLVTLLPTGGTGYPPNQAAYTRFVYSTPSPLSSTGAAVTISTDGAGNILTAVVSQEGLGFVIGSTYFIQLPSPPGTAVYGEIMVDSLTAYTRLIYSAVDGIVDYGNGLYLNTDSLAVGPPTPVIGTDTRPMIAQVDGGTPQYYSAEIITALNALGYELNTCP